VAVQGGGGHGRQDLRRYFTPLRTNGPHPLDCFAAARKDGQATVAMTSCVTSPPFVQTDRILWIASLPLAKTGRPRSPGPPALLHPPSYKRTASSGLLRCRSQRRAGHGCQDLRRYFTPLRTNGPHPLDCFAAARKDGQATVARTSGVTSPPSYKRTASSGLLDLSFPRSGVGMQPQTLQRRISNNNSPLYAGAYRAVFPRRSVGTM